jgi:hypothetical protein
MSQDNEPELHESVQLLLSRMESHPEEFDGIGPEDGGERMYTSLWGSVISRYWKLLTQEEQAAVTLGLRTANRKNFHSAVMKTILGDKGHLTSKEVYKPYHQMELTGMVTANEYANAAKALGVYK